jgi:hypothetical protein
MKAVKYPTGGKIAIKKSHNYPADHCSMAAGLVFSDVL